MQRSCNEHTILQAVTDPDQGYQGLSTGQIFNPKLLAELKRELSKAFTNIYSSWTMLIKPYRAAYFNLSQNNHLQDTRCLLRTQKEVNHYSAFLSHAAFLPNPGESVIYRGTTTLDPI